MTTSINTESLLVGWQLGEQVVLCGENAEKAAAILGTHTEEAPNGTPRLLLNRRYQDTAYPKLVKAGYKIAIRVPD